MQFRSYVGKFPSGSLALFITVMATLLFTNRQAQAQQIVSFDPVSSMETIPTVLNDSGSVVGWYLDTVSLSHAFIRDSTGTITSVDFPGTDTETFGFGINNAGTITGNYISAADSLFHGFVRDSAGTFTAFDAAATAYTTPASINSSGQVVGTVFTLGSFCRSKSSTCAFVRDASGVITVFLPTSTTTAVRSATGNDAGQITGSFGDSLQTGTHGYYRGRLGAITQFDAPGAGTGTFGGTLPLAINNNGVIAGVFGDDAGVYHGFTRDLKNNYTQIDYPGALDTWATGVNLTGTVTGYYMTADEVYHGFVRDKLGNFTSFDDSHAGTLHGEGTTAMAINRFGQITGYFKGINHEYHGFYRKAK